MLTQKTQRLQDLNRESFDYLHGHALKVVFFYEIVEVDREQLKQNADFIIEIEEVDHFDN